MSPVRRILPTRLRGFYVRHRAGIGYVLLVAYVTAVGGWAFDRVDGVQDTLVVNQCKDLKVRIGQSQQFLDTRAEQEPGLADYVRTVTLPDLRKRLRELPSDTDC